MHACDVSNFFSLSSRRTSSGKGDFQKKERPATRSKCHNSFKIYDEKISIGLLRMDLKPRRAPKIPVRAPARNQERGGVFFHRAQGPQRRSWSFTHSARLGTSFTMAESELVAIEPRPSTIINAFGGDNGGLIHKADARLGDFADFFEQMGEVAGVLEEAGLSSDKVRVRAWGLVCIPRTSRR